MKPPKGHQKIHQQHMKQGKKPMMDQKQMMALRMMKQGQRKGK